ncbi:MAG: hypothetical protein LBB24_00405 [Rickettsiales bacterium]|jgi:hypothetical protein|nr:hypothetical protein [Rickettsiales bacterium]
MSEKTDNGVSEEASNRMLNPNIFQVNKTTGKVELIDSITNKDITLLEEEGYLEKGMDLNSAHLSAKFVDELMIGNVRNKYSGVVSDLPINFVNCCEGKEVEAEKSPGLTVVYSERKKHYLLIARKPVANGKTEIYVMDSNSNVEIPEVEAAYGNKSEFIIKYPSTPISRYDGDMFMTIETKMREKMATGESEMEELVSLCLEQSTYFPNSLGIQKDTNNCMSYSVHFARKLYKAVQNKMSETGKSVVECFGQILDGFERYVGQYEGKARDMFFMPDVFLKYGGSETAVNKDIELMGLTKDSDRGKDLRRNIVAFKNKRDEDAKRLGERRVGITSIRDSYSPAKNWKNKDIKTGARMVKKLKLEREKASTEVNAGVATPEGGRYSPNRITTPSPLTNGPTRNIMQSLSAISAGSFPAEQQLNNITGSAVPPPCSAWERVIATGKREKGNYYINIALFSIEFTAVGI